MELIILSGLPGCGKSTMATALKNDCLYTGNTVAACSADDHFLDDTGRYNFDPSQLGIAHKKCREKAQSAVDSGVSRVIIDNTNTSWKEIKPYAKMGKAAGYDILFFRLDCDLADALRRNTHDVPLESLTKMIHRMAHEPTGEITSLISELSDNA